MSLSLSEQEVMINATRDETVATLYASDNTWITKMDKLVAKNPELFKITKENEWGKTYEFPKKLISIRSSIRTFSEEEKEKASERLKLIRKKKNSNN